MIPAALIKFDGCGCIAVLYMGHLVWSNGDVKIEHNSQLRKSAEGKKMDIWTEILMIIGVGYTSWIITKFIIWLDTPKKKRRRLPN